MTGTIVDSQDRLGLPDLDVEDPASHSKRFVGSAPSSSPVGLFSRYGTTAAVAALWIVGAAVTAILVHQRYRGAVSGGIGADFQIYLHAAHLVAAGHNPYRGNGTFIYPPTLALFLAPFVHAGPTHVFHFWTALELAALVVGVAAFVAMQAPRLRPGWRPVLYLVCIVTALHFWPLTIGLFLGQADTFVFAALMLSAWAAARDLPGTRGALIAVAGLLKTWPAVVALALLQRSSERRLRSIVAFAATIVIAPALALALGGGSGLADFVKSVISARTQHLVSDSVWGAPDLLFSNTGLARPVAVSPLLHSLSTAVLLIWVVGLLVVALRTSGDRAMCTWNVTFCTVLLLPVSHLAYTLYCLPVLWLWTSRILESKRITWRQLVVPGILFVWWIVQTKAWPDSGSSSSIGAMHYIVVFAASLVACTASVTGAHFIRPPDRQGCGSPDPELEAASSLP
jgi:hypothetical protein